MSFREKTAWISLVSVLGIYGVYFTSVGHTGWVGNNIHFGGLLSTTIALAVVQTVLTVVVAIFKPDEAKAPCDERDKLIELRSTRCAYYGLATSVVFACFFGAMDPPIIFNANALLFLLVTAEVLRFGCQIVQYRLSA